MCIYYVCVFVMSCMSFDCTVTNNIFLNSEHHTTNSYTWVGERSWHRERGNSGKWCRSCQWSSWGLYCATDNSYRNCASGHWTYWHWGFATFLLFIQKCRQYTFEKCTKEDSREKKKNKRPLGMEDLMELKRKDWILKKEKYLLWRKLPQYLKDNSLNRWYTTHHPSLSLLSLSSIKYWQKI